MGRTKYPVVLVHGLAAKTVLFWNCFGSIPRFLREQDVRVFVPNHDGVGTIRGNAHQLKAQIEAICAAENCEKVNIIAHSKGGLDAREMITSLQMHHRVASLTTLSTPHHGSRLSATLLKAPKWSIHICSLFVNCFYRILGDRNPDIWAAAKELTDTSMEVFNRKVFNHPNVYYQSYSSKASKANAFLVYIPYQVSRYCERDETDGMVSVHSSQWGTYQGNVEGDLNHLQLTALMGGKRKRQAVAEFYLQLITQLRDMGY